MSEQGIPNPAENTSEVTPTTTPEPAPAPSTPEPAVAQTTTAADPALSAQLASQSELNTRLNEQLNTARADLKQSTADHNAIQAQVTELTAERDQLQASVEASNTASQASAMQMAKLRHLIQAYLPEGINLDDELDFVVGLRLEEGKVVGEPRYRRAVQPAAPATPAPAQSTQERRKPKPQGPTIQDRVNQSRRERYGLAEPDAR